MAYRAPMATARFEHEIKKSRFIGIATPASTDEDVSNALAELRMEFPDATHHAWAYVLGNPIAAPRMRADDDGEPAGTAGKPILHVLTHRGVGDVLVVVVRYFGGMKLGAGGLRRAYSKTASGVLDEVALKTVRPRVKISLHLDFGDEAAARRLLLERGIEILSVDYGDSAQLVIGLPEDEVASFTREVSERTSGRARIEQ